MNTPLNRPKNGRRYLTASLIQLVFGAVMLFSLSQSGTPVPLPSAGASPIQCLSYAPFRLPGETPFDPNFRVTAERIEADLRLLKKLTRCVRTYATSQGLDAVPGIARRLGMTVMLGAWLGRDHEANLAAIEHAAIVAAQEPDTVSAVIIGNEVLLRRERSGEQMRAYLRLANEKISQAVTYADVWEFWLENISLLNEVDFVTIHILPFWEDHPVGIKQAAAYVAQTYHQVRKLLPDTRILIGETGWPSAGRMRGPARPGKIEQARFIREWMILAQRENIPYNLIEAFDQPWKRHLEGAMGGHWGVFKSDGSQKFPLTGAVTENPTIYALSLRSAAIFGLILVTVFLLSGWRDRKVSRQQRLGGAIASACIGITAGLSLPTAWQYLTVWNRTGNEWAAGSGLWLFAILAACSLPFVLRAAQAPRAFAQTMGFNNARAGASSRPTLASTIYTLARFAILLAGAIMVIYHLFDPRYRGYPTALYVIPASCFVTLALARIKLPANAIEERLLAWIIILAMPVLVWQSWPNNSQAFVWLAIMLMIAIPNVLKDTGTSKPRT